MEYLYSLTIALFLTIALIPLLIRLSTRLGLIDDPSAERKVHAVVMPRTGGLGIIIGAALPLLFLLPFEGEVGYLFIGCAIIVVFGLLDDRLELSYKWKLFGQALAALVVMAGGIAAHKLPFLGLDSAPLWLSYPITFFFLVGVVNGVNFSDGLDGLAAGTSIMALLLIFLLAFHVDNYQVAMISLTVVGGVLGFLRYNTFPANIFMGDAGSQFLGFIIACLALMVTQDEIAPYSAFLPVLILGIPIMDIIQVVPVRVHKKLPLPGPDKEHFHHQIGKLGFTHTEVVGIIYILQTILMAGAFVFRFHVDFVVAAFYAVFVFMVLGALLLGNYRDFSFHPPEDIPGRERRNNFLRRFDWYYHNSGRYLAVLLGVFLLAAAHYAVPGTSHLRMGLSLLGGVIASALLTRFAQAQTIFRCVLYLACVMMAYLLLSGELGETEVYVVVGSSALLLVSLMLAIRMTRKSDFRLTTQDLLITLVIVLVPLLPIDLLQQYALGRVILLVALLMYTSEFILHRATRMVAFTSGCAIAALLALF
ncbi:undecaprenyl/decaprenyl-phosphate alpha-N-acetylglucosaminyl 1-phosphate transferase [Mangrovimicrobium sediminis]|uniref:Undecaprenyl/decaprenyl-phosphate alpha-N-acetylglucosaminyl 1-phosphate transferase n=1 Tax=Mangrovimicrobium sediminis TaxID=2562682 RepID=A0A4Z0LXC1_9GAMM|nr:MraY family glycosyltransferase [Haliea sp. SAOS-164]TGD71890.1 undecaprenyl/decaprenyl-phosphate alpha-N-acetylglucosaminyl 1-phosphate transferase [Haliea sp. SAOS-164]